MRKILFLLLAMIFLTNRPCQATDHSNDLLSLIKLMPGTTTQQNVKAIFGMPAKVEESKKRAWWHYNHGNGNLIICWSKKSDLLERFSYTSAQVEKVILDNNVYKKLKSGATDMMQAIKLLGVPKDMTIKEFTQEMHYTYQKNVLRLFFRDRVLVDFTLLSQN